MEQNTTPKRDPALVLACVLVILFGVINFFSGIPVLSVFFGAGARFLAIWRFLLLFLLGALMIFAGICGLANKMKKAWKLFGYAMLIISVSLLLAIIFMEGINAAYLLNVLAAIVYLAKVK